MIRLLKRLFTDHPREVGEGYFAHMIAAARFGARLLRLSAIAFLHAVVPGLCKTTVSNAVRAMAAEIDGRVDEARAGRMRETGVWDPGL
jgi:hypothetical protein